MLLFFCNKIIYKFLFLVFLNDWMIVVVYWWCYSFFFLRFGFLERIVVFLVECDFSFFFSVWIICCSFFILILYFCFRFKNFIWKIFWLLELFIFVCFCFSFCLSLDNFFFYFIDWFVIFVLWFIFCFFNKVLCFFSFWFFFWIIFL